MDRADLGSEYNGMLLSHARKEILPSATVWMDFKDIMLSEMSQKSDRYHMLSLVALGPVRRTVAARSWGLGDQGCVGPRAQAPNCERMKFWDLCTTVCCTCKSLRE